MNAAFGFLIFDFGFANKARQPQRKSKIKNPKSKIQNRRGLTLLEVVIALAIFLFSLTAIMQLLSFSRDRVVDGYLRSQANLRAQSKLAEVLAGAEPVTGSGWTPFSDNPDWSWQIVSNSSSLSSNLYTVQVGVRKKRGNGYLEVSLNQMVFSPSQRGSTLVYLANITDGSNPSTQQASSSSSSSMAGGAGGGTNGAASTAKTGTTGGATKGGTTTGGGATRSGATGGAAGGTGRGGGAGTGRGGGGTGAGAGRGGGGGTGGGGMGGGRGGR